MPVSPRRRRCSGVRSVPDLLLAAAGLILASVAVGLFRVLRGPQAADRMMAAQLLASGGIAALLLLDAATGIAGIVDVALALALLAAFASVAFVLGGRDPPAA